MYVVSFLQFWGEDPSATVHMLAHWGLKDEDRATVVSVTALLTHPQINSHPTSSFMSCPCFFKVVTSHFFLKKKTTGGLVEQAKIPLLLLVLR